MRSFLSLSPLLCLCLLLGGCHTSSLLTPPLLRLPDGIEVACDWQSVADVHDGDTLTLADGRKVRLLGIDTPELSQAPLQAWALAARDFVREKIARQPVCLATDPVADRQDDYGRLLRYVYLANGNLLNKLLLEHGIAKALTSFPLSRAVEFVMAEDAAFAASQGIWQFDARESDLPIQTAEQVQHLSETSVRVRFMPYSVRRQRNNVLFCSAEFDAQQHCLGLLLVIYPDQQRQLRRAGYHSPQTDFVGKELLISGFVRPYHGSPGIILSLPAAIVFPPT